VNAAAGAGGAPVVVVHPIHQHAYETVVAAQEAGLLGCFWTALYDTRRGLTDPRLWSRLPGRLRQPLYGRLRLRSHPELDPSGVATLARYHATAAAALAAPQPLRRLLKGRLDRWATRRFDHAVARRLDRAGPPRLVHAFEGGCVEVLRAAKRVGAATVLDVPSAHEYHLRAVREEGGVVAPWCPVRQIHAERALADHLFAPSDNVVACLLEHGVPAERIVKVPYGADPDRFVPGGRRDGPFRVLFVGQIGLRKGVRYLLEAWRRLALRDAELVLAGPADDDGLELLRRHAGRHRWLGPVPRHEVERAFRGADVFAFPSLAEGSALVTYEAMASGLAVVTTPESGSVVRDGVDGFVVAARDPHALAERLALLARDRDLARQMGTRARERIQRGYTWRHYRWRVAGAYAAIQRGGRPEPARAGADRA